jgi:restriction system protein
MAGRSSQVTYAQIERQKAAAQRKVQADLRRSQAEQKRQARDQRIAYADGRQEMVANLNNQLRKRVESLESVLRSSLASKPRPLDFKTLKTRFKPPAFDAQGADRPAAVPELGPLMPARLGFFAVLIPGTKAKHLAAVQVAEELHRKQLAKYAASEKRRDARLDAARQNHEAALVRLKLESDDQHVAIDKFESEYKAGEASAVVKYYSIVLQHDVLPANFPRLARIAYVPESKQLVVERQLPTVAIIPTESAHRYVRAADRVDSSPRPASQIRALYGSIVAQTALRTMSVLLAASKTEAVETIVLNCFVDTTNPATGQRITPCLLTARINFDVLRKLNLAQVDPVACLRTLNAQVSRSPHELAAVKPIVDFDMVDPRFIDKTDLLATLDSRPNLAELTPSEFEVLMTNLFEKMGLETRLTQASRDGGVDCVAWDTRPIIGGKVVIQAKRYKHTVGVSAVRDLFGTLMNEGAAKGILVTTSGYGKSAYTFADNKPLELITGSNLLYLLAQHCALEAKIDFPEEWIDPVADSEDLEPTPLVFMNDTHEMA